VLDHRSRLALVALCIPTLQGAPEARAQTTSDTIRIEQAIAEALHESPQVRAARLRAEVLRERDTRAGALPDPVLSLGLMNRPFDFDADQAVTMNQIQLSQRLPWAGKRSSSQAREEGLARAADLDAVEVTASVVERVRTLYYHIAYIDRAVGVMQETQSLLADLRETASTLYSVGSAVQQDVLRAQVARARMEADIRVMREQRVAAAARLNALLGRAPDASIGSLELPDPVSEVPELDALMGLAEHRPAVRAARARVEAATAQRDFSDKAHLPDFAVTVGYSQRPEFDDLFSVMVGIPIPVRRGSSQEPLRRESEAEEVAAEASELELYNETYASLAERRSEAVRAADVSELLRTDVLPQARAAVESGLSAYRVGRLDFMAVLESRMLVNQYEIERLRLAAEHQGALAAIDALIGVIPGGVQ
jgi:outer membrane protein TolC